MPSVAKYAPTPCGHLICASTSGAHHLRLSNSALIPYRSLANCGHTFCQDCLTDWFNTTLGRHRQTSARGLSPYTCPSCRIPVRMPPVQNFSIKRIVRLAAESRGESSPRRPQAPPPPVTVPPHRGRGGVRRDFPSGPFDVFFGR